ncbi:MAG TPA: spherulation-specific family 4 protein [Burkholderiales bacterium]|nr:spherulation-specific family 4 protein [Burkholderiales bacterium]
MTHQRARSFVIYYGWLTDGPQGAPNAGARRIASAAPPLLIAQPWTAAPAGHCNLSPQVLALLRDARIEVHAYVATGFGRGDASTVLQALDAAAGLAVQGIFLDEVDPLVHDATLGFYARLSSAARAAGKQVIANTGVARCGERVMQIADRLMVEHQWRELCKQSPWSAKYERDRFMGVSSNEEHAMGYDVDSARAAADARDAWALGIGWHAATERYIELPEWFDA